MFEVRNLKILRSAAKDFRLGSLSLFRPHTNEKGDRMSKAASLMTLAASAALALAPAAAPATPKLIATVGPGESITLTTASGAKVRSLRAGTYTIVVRDRSAEHNFRLSGPGANRTTAVGFTGTTTWRNVKFTRGKTYLYVCDPHADDMRGSFKAS